MDREALDRYVDRSVSLIEASPQMDEQNTRAKLVDPLVREVLGWDLYSTEVELEYPIQMGSSRTKVDYALLLEGSPAAFIEAKGCDTTLTERHEDQLRSYMQQQWVDWGLLTNGVVLELFKLRKSEDNPSVELLGESEVSELRRHSWLVRTLSKESIRSGDAEGIYRSVERRRRAVSQLTQQKDEISDELLKVLSEHVGDSIAREVESETKSFIDGLVESSRTASYPASNGRQNRHRQFPKTSPNQEQRFQRILRRTVDRRRVSTSSRLTRTERKRPIEPPHRATQWRRPSITSSRSTI